MDQQQQNNDLMYLPKDLWSPRYDSNFFTIQIIDKLKVESKATMPALPAGSGGDADADAGAGALGSNSSMVGGNTNFPAYYYQIILYRSHTQKSIYRRYSQFQWLYKELMKNPPPPPLEETHHDDNVVVLDEEPIRFPPSLSSADADSCRSPSCAIMFFRQFSFLQNDTFAQYRMVQLQTFLDNVLGRGPQYSSHPAVKQFLHL